MCACHCVCVCVCVCGVVVVVVVGVVVVAVAVVAAAAAVLVVVVVVVVVCCCCLLTMQKMLSTYETLRRERAHSCTPVRLRRYMAVLFIQILFTSLCLVYARGFFVSAEELARKAKERYDAVRVSAQFTRENLTGLLIDMTHCRRTA